MCNSCNVSLASKWGKYNVLDPDYIEEKYL